MLTPRLAALALACITVASSAPTLRVLRVTPSGDAEPGTPITVTFDRPVAGGLDGTVDAASFFRIEPAVPGRVEWRDPVTIRFTPAAPLPRYTSYRVTIAAGLRAMDGARLEAPYTYTFRVAGPRVLAGAPANAWGVARFLPPTPTLTLYLDDAADAGVVARVVRIEVARPCAPAVVPVRVVRQRALEADDPYYARVASRPDGPVDGRRAVEVAPVRPLPAGCAGALVVPERIDEASPGVVQRWALATHGGFALAWFGCAGKTTCATGPLEVTFTTPVRGSEVLRHVRVEPKLAFTIADTAAESDVWTLEARTRPRSHYAVVVDAAGLRDVFGQPFTGTNVLAFATSGIPPAVVYPFGKMVVERNGFGTLAVQHVNVDTLLVTYATVPRRLEAAFLADAWGGWRALWDTIAPGATRLAVPVRGEPDRARVTGVKVRPAGAAGTLVAVRVAAPRKASQADAGSPIALVQVTDLAVHARVGKDQGAVWVTGVSDGRPRAGASVTLFDRSGRVRARGRTDASGVAVLGGFAPDSAAAQDASCPECEDDVGSGGFVGYVAATLGDDRAVVGISEWDPDLSPWRFGADRAWGVDAWPVAGAIFTERGIYRPGETVYAKAIVRTGPLGSLVPPPASDSIRLVFADRERGNLLQRTVAPNRFGTADASLRLPAEAPLGTYAVRVEVRRDGRWRPVATTTYQVAEYRPPEFLVDMSTPDTVRYAGDTLRAALSARYLFGAPMGRAPVQWTVRQEELSPWGLSLPGLDGWEIGGAGWWGDEGSGSREPAPRVVATGTDTLDAAGRRELRFALPVPPTGAAMRTTMVATVVDANRQTVSASVSVVSHAASFYIAAKPSGEAWFWKAGTPVSIQVLAARPDGGRVAGVPVTGRVVRHEWHRVRRYRNGYGSDVGEWVADTVATCALTTAAEPRTCTFTPKEGGAYTVELTAPDPKGRTATTAFTRWVTGPGWVPWEDGSQFKIELIADKPRYTVGDTATVLIAAPFTGVEAWVTVERERILEQRRIRIGAGSTALKFPITEAFVPNAYVSVMLVRGRSAPPGPVDDPGRPTLRVGYVELRVTPEPKRLNVAVRPLQAEYRPGDSARVAVQVTNGHGGGERAEVTLWAVDEGVLALTGYRTPDPLDLIYARRGLGVRLASNLVSVAPQIPEGEKGRREPGGGGGRDATGVLRSQFRPTAFFLASVETDENGRATAAAKLPDNVTTFRIMAVAVTTGDRYGSGESSLLATRPLVARPALPRFLRAGDEFVAGVVVNRRLGGTPKVRVAADVTGVALAGPKTRTATLEPGRGVEVRFPFRGVAGDSARFRFDARAEGEADAVQVKLPIRPGYHPVTHTLAGALHDTATVELSLPADIDPKRSRLELSLGESPLALLEGYRRHLEVYPYGCTEQVASQALPLIALYRAQQTLPGAPPLLEGDPRAEIAKAVRVLARRQRADGGIGYWSETDWTTPWLSAYAGRVLLEARAAGVPVSDDVLARLADYLAQALHREPEVRFAVASWYADPAVPLADRVLAADFLSRLGRADVPAENELLAHAAQLAWEDRLALAEMLARRRQTAAARALVTSTLADVRVEGRKAVLPARAARSFYFPSQARPAARAVTALLAADPTNRLLGPLVETLVDQGRVQALAPWNTQDYGMAVLALAQLARAGAVGGERPVRVRQGGRTVLEAKPAGGVGQAGVALDGLLGPASGERRPLRLRLETTPGELPVFYYLTVREVPRAAATTPRDEGIAVERWYERLSDGKPTVEIAEGELVRVRLRVTVPAERHFVVLDDALPAGLEPVDLSLRTVSPFLIDDAAADQELVSGSWYYGSWDAGVWSPFDHKEIRDERVVYSATVLWPGTYTATYLARGTTAGRFVTPPAHAEEMYNPGVHGRNGGSTFTVRAVK
ncbi:MAG: Ig-like domain-containing protein [Gemmatimonadetes bacterium]|nr:Ig-like domain-containing protein [Gemmatimonadota bacterium]